MDGMDGTTGPRRRPVVQRRAGNSPRVEEPTQRDGVLDGARESVSVHHGASRIANVVLGFVRCDHDARSVEELCRCCGVGVAPGTLRDWCRREGVTAGDILDWARLVRATVLACREGCSFREFIDADSRTVRAMLDRGGLTDWASRDVTPEGLCQQQRFVDNGVVVKEILQGLQDAEA